MNYYHYKAISLIMKVRAVKAVAQKEVGISHEGIISSYEDAEEARRFGHL